jgi:hypothetical protein
LSRVTVVDEVSGSWFLKILCVARSSSPVSRHQSNMKQARFQQQHKSSRSAFRLQPKTQTVDIECPFSSECRRPAQPTKAETNKLFLIFIMVIIKHIDEIKTKTDISIVVPKSKSLMVHLELKHYWRAEARRRTTRNCALKTYTFSENRFAFKFQIVDGYVKSRPLN